MTTSNNPKSAHKPSENEKSDVTTNKIPSYASENSAAKSKNDLKTDVKSNSSNKDSKTANQHDLNSSQHSSNTNEQSDSNLQQHSSTTQQVDSGLQNGPKRSQSVLTSHEETTLEAQEDDSTTKRKEGAQKVVPPVYAAPSAAYRYDPQQGSFSQLGTSGNAQHAATDEQLQSDETRDGSKFNHSSVPQPTQSSPVPGPQYPPCPYGHHPMYCQPACRQPMYYRPQWQPYPSPTHQPQGSIWEANPSNQENVDDTPNSQTSHSTSKASVFNDSNSKYEVSNVISLQSNAQNDSTSPSISKTDQVSHSTIQEGKQSAKELFSDNLPAASQSSQEPLLNPPKSQAGPCPGIQHPFVYLPQNGHYLTYHQSAGPSRSTSNPPDPSLSDAKSTESSQRLRSSRRKRRASSFPYFRPRYYSLYPPEKRLGQTKSEQQFPTGADLPRPSEEGPLPPDWAGFENQKVRSRFIRKVYSIIFIQLVFTLGVIAVFIFVPEVKQFVKDHIYIYFISFAVFAAVYLGLACFRNLRRKFPLNMIMLFIFTLAFSYMLGAVSSVHDTETVLLAMGVTAVVTLVVTIFSFQTKFDFTSCGSIICILLMVLILFGIITMFFHVKVMVIVYSSLGAIVFTLMLAYDTQMLIGGKTCEISPEEYVFAALQIYLDIFYIMMFLLMLISGSGDQ